MNAKPFLIISGVLNLVLIGFFARNQQPATAAITPPRPMETAHLSVRPVQGQLVTVTNNIVQKLDWRSVESDDYRNYITNLRAIGCPEETIEDIIKADVNKLFQSRRKVLTDSTEGFKFWKPGNPFSNARSPEHLQKQQELARDQRAILKDLLGTESKAEDVATSNPLSEVLGFLSVEQQNQIVEVRERFKNKAMNGAGTQEQRLKNLREAEQQMEKEMSTIMNEGEKEEYELRLSQTSAKMREHLASFEPSEQEFRGIFKFRKEFEDSVANLAAQPGSEAQKRAAEERFYAQVRSFLGEKRFTDFQRAIDK